MPRRFLPAFILIIASIVGCGGARTIPEEVIVEAALRPGGALSAAAPIYGVLGAYDTGGPAEGSVEVVAEAFRTLSQRYPPVLRHVPAPEGRAVAVIPGTVLPGATVVLAAVGPGMAGRLAGLATATAEAVRGGDLAFPVRTLAFVAAADLGALRAHLEAGPRPLAVLVLCAPGACDAGPPPAAFEGASPFLALMVAALRGAPADTSAPLLALPSAVPAFAVRALDGEALRAAATAAYAASTPSLALLEQGADLLAREAQRSAVGLAPAARDAWWAWHDAGAAQLFALALPEQRPRIAERVGRLRETLRGIRDDAPVAAAGSASVPRQ